ncbi:MAG: class II fructose-bisphosphate aldolase, partial [bacterium]
LDHGKSLEYIRGAIEAGYDAVHFDGSQLPLEENIRITKEVVKLARKKGILTEGEVGVIGGELTRPEEAAKFVKETKVDNLAVNLGTLHGMPEKWEDFETIDLERLKEIKEAAGNIGLVLHGGSGVSAEEIKKAIKQGIVKINISSELRSAFTKTLKEVLAKNPGEMIPYKYMPAVIDGVQKIVEEKIKLFNFYADSNG